MDTRIEEGAGATAAAVSYRLPSSPLFQPLHPSQPLSCRSNCSSSPSSKYCSTFWTGFSPSPNEGAPGVASNEWNGLLSYPSGMYLPPKSAICWCVCWIACWPPYESNSEALVVLAGAAGIFSLLEGVCFCCCCCCWCFLWKPASLRIGMWTTSSLLLSLLSLLCGCWSSSFRAISDDTSSDFLLSSSENAVAMTSFFRMKCSSSAFSASSPTPIGTAFFITSKYVTLPTDVSFFASVAPLDAPTKTITTKCTSSKDRRIVTDKQMSVRPPKNYSTNPGMGLLGCTTQIPHNSASLGTELVESGPHCTVGNRFVVHIETHLPIDPIRASVTKNAHLPFPFRRLLRPAMDDTASVLFGRLVLLEADDGREQGEEETGQSGRLDQQYQPTDDGRNQREELDFVRQQQRNQKLFVLLLEVELFLAPLEGDQAPRALLRAVTIVIVVVVGGGGNI
uniref:Uncharacterized protein n=1 Tax=Anopheles atroparvus TaxID=41427 RepID=A0A182IVB9_ANOAO